MTTRLILLLFALLFFGEASAYRNKKVILLASNEDQKDSIGYNVVDEMGRYVYDWVQQGKLKLWDSPEKKYMVSFTDLQGIENSTNTHFSELNNLFLYETWTSRPSTFSFRLKGFSFSNTGADGQDVLYGYIEYDSSIQKLLSKAYLRVNANGPYGITLLQALMNKEYAFDVIFFFDSPVNSYEQGTRIQRKALRTKKTRLNYIPVPKAKLIEYAITDGASPLTKNSEQFRKSLESFFNKNQQEFFNYGGDRFYSYLKKTPVLLNEIHVLEIWYKEGDSIRYEPVQVVPYLFGSSLNAIPIKQISEWKIKVGNQPMTDVIKQKKFYYELYKVNGTIIEKDEQKAYQNALFTHDWNDILPKETIEKE